MSSPIIRSSLPVFEALRLVANSPVPLSTADLSKMMKLPTSTVHRFLGTLEETGYIARYAGSARYIPGNMPQHLCRALYNRFPLSRIGPPFLQRLAMSTHESVTLTVRIGWFGLRIEAIGDAAQVIEIAGANVPAPLHSGLEGRAILAFMADAEQAEYKRFSASGVGAFPPPKGSFWKDLREFWKAGFYSAPLESSPGRAALALPIRNRAGDAVASIGLLGPVVGAGVLKRTPEISSWMNIRDELEGVFQSNAGNMITPFSHLKPDAILPPPQRTRKSSLNQTRRARVPGASPSKSKTAS
jgi:IclR family acetate operon transcriptional repressor